MSFFNFTSKLFNPNVLKFAVPDLRWASKYKLKTHKGCAKRFLKLSKSTSIVRKLRNDMNNHVADITVASTKPFQRVSKYAFVKGKHMKKTLRGMLPYL